VINYSFLTPAFEGAYGAKWTLWGKEAGIGLKVGNEKRMDGRIVCTKVQYRERVHEEHVITSCRYLDSPTDTLSHA
jgi:hypothetical protein